MSFGQVFRNALADHGDRIAITSDREQITYAQALLQSDNLAGHFRKLGLKAGDRIGLAMQDNVDVLLSIIACWRIAATPLVVDFRVPRSQRARNARDFGLAAVLENRTMPGDEIYPNVLFAKSWRTDPAEAPQGPVDCSRPAFLMLSSGTTGEPKGYLQSHGALEGRVMSRKTALAGTAKRFLTPMTLSYSATRHQFLGYLFFGGTVRFFPALFTPSELIEAFLSFKASGTALPPPVIARLVREVGERRMRLLPDLDLLYSVGGPAREEDKIAAYTYVTPGYRISYASSLTGVISALSGPDILVKPESSGRPINTVRIDILDPLGKPLSAGEKGLIKAWTPTMASSVLAPGNTPVIDPSMMGDGWGIPGDIGFVDDEGFLTIVDREADMIVRGGVNVAPQELEKLIRTHAHVLDVAVAGFPDETMGQEIAVFVVTEKATVDDIRAFLRANVAPDRRPREIRLVRSLPYNDNGKLLRRQLVEALMKEAAPVR